MKKLIVLLVVLGLTNFVASVNLQSQDKPVPKGWENYKEQYEDNYNEDFEVIWDAVLKTLQDISCQTITRNTRPTDDGLFRGTIHSDFCVFTMGDTTFQVLRKYSLDMPFVRGGKWDNGRLQYKLSIREVEPGNVNLILKTEMSGMESGVTKKVLFWRSNGLLELEFLENIRKNIGLKPTDE